MTLPSSDPVALTGPILIQFLEYAENIGNPDKLRIVRCRKIEFPPPNEDARLDILKIHSRKMNLTRLDFTAGAFSQLHSLKTSNLNFSLRGINLRKIAEQMGGSSGAEVKGTCTEAGL